MPLSCFGVNSGQRKAGRTKIRKRVFAMEKVILPQMGEGIEEAVIAAWLVSVGDRVNKGDDIVELATDKATFNVPSPASGVIKKILYKEGTTAKIGDTLAEIER